MTLRLVLLAVLYWVTQTGAAGELGQALEGPRHVLLMRHAYAPGVGDPPGYRLDDCSTQRNLDEQGRAQARRNGDWLRQQGVRSARVFSSIWCRCRDSADALSFGTVTTEASLASFFDSPGRAQASNAALAAFIARAVTEKGQHALILVTHHVNIREYMGRDIGSGDMVLVQVDASGRPLRSVVHPSPR